MSLARWSEKSPEGAGEGANYKQTLSHVPGVQNRRLSTLSFVANLAALPIRLSLVLRHGGKKSFM